MHIKLLEGVLRRGGPRSFSRGAKENEVSQSAASQMVQQLEERLGVRLLDRSKRPLGADAGGDRFLPRLPEAGRSLCRRWKRKSGRLHEEVAGRVRVASIYSVGLSHMNQSVQEFLGAVIRRRTCGSSISIRIGCTSLVERDQADVGLVSYPQSSRTISAIPWRDEPMVVVCAPRHEFAERDQIELRELHGRRIGVVRQQSADPARD